MKIATARCWSLLTNFDLTEASKKYNIHESVSFLPRVRVTLYLAPERLGLSLREVDKTRFGSASKLPSFRSLILLFSCKDVLKFCFTNFSYVSLGCLCHDSYDCLPSFVNGRTASQLSREMHSFKTCSSLVLWNPDLFCVGCLMEFTRAWANPRSFAIFFLVSAIVSWYGRTHFVTGSLLYCEMFW